MDPRTLNKKKILQIRGTADPNFLKNFTDPRNRGPEIKQKFTDPRNHGHVILKKYTTNPQNRGPVILIFKK